MILFLDFDGVLHPEYCERPVPEDEVFCHLPRLERVLRDFPTVEIVISSMWRYSFPLERLRERFSEDIRVRIISITPLIDLNEGGGPRPTREDEIAQWMVENNQQSEDWLALDDAVWQFPTTRHRVIGCVSYRGFDDKVADALRKRLA